MSLFNQLLGMNPASEGLLQVIGLSVNEVSRFRDTFFVREGEKLHEEDPH
jgi:hypothetical protein